MAMLINSVNRQVIFKMTIDQKPENYQLHITMNLSENDDSNDDNTHRSKIKS